MIKKSILFLVAVLFCFTSFSQVDTAYIYNTETPYGTLDIRLARSSTRYYYLQEGKTFSFRESAPGVKTNTFRDMTTWDSSPYTQGNLREKNGSHDNFVMNYRLLFPLNYNASFADGYPLIIMVHGLGERGNCWDNDCYWADRTWKPSTNSPAAPTTSTLELLNNDHNLLHGGSVHLEMRNAAGSLLPGDPSMPSRSFPGFVLFPQNLNGWDTGSQQDAIRIIRLLIKKYNINPDRIYIHGLSNGGAAVYNIIKRAPWLFAAAAPMSAVSDGGVINANMLPQISSIPLWIFQGGLDTNPTPFKTEGYVKHFLEAGMTVKYTRYDNLGHGVWNTAYDEPEFFTWLRSKNKSQIHIYADNPTICQTNGQGVRMNLAEGFLAYQWERNGVIIAGATGAYFTATENGTYRARFSRKSSNPSSDQWNQWSDPVIVTTSNPVQAQIIQTGTVLLKDLNNYGYALLHSANEADHYYWYKDGTLLNLSGNRDDTTRHVILKAGDCSSGACTGNGAYTLVTAAFNNCPSPSSEALHIFFNNQAPVNINPPTSFTGHATSESTATLNWNDASSNEGGFEIWRREKTGSSSYTKWVMPVLTHANVETFNDSGLEPSSTYQYKVRAVSSTGRSDYTPSSKSEFLVIETAEDTQNPSIPQNVTASSTGIQEITLSWQPSSDNTGIREYIIYYGTSTVNTGSSASTYTLKDLPLNNNFSFTIKAKDLGDNLSGASNSASGSTYVNGLYYNHTTGAFTDIDLIDWSVAEYNGTVDNFTLAPRSQEDYFNFEFEGYLYITQSGSYQFQTSSDDGSRLTLDNIVLVDNDGLHGTTTKTSTAKTLSSGPHTVNVKYFENTGGQNLTVRYNGPDTRNRWIVIPDEALRSGNEPSAEAIASNENDEPGRKNDQRNNDRLHVHVYPNPVLRDGEVTIRINDVQPAPVLIKFMDFMGNSYYENTVEANELADGFRVVPAARLREGLYVLMIQQEQQVVKRILLVRN